MTPAEIRDVVVRALVGVAPEVNPAELEDRDPLRDSLDLDSMDYLNLLITLSKRLQIEIPERDYAQLQTLGGIVAYLSAKLPAPSSRLQ